MENTRSKKKSRQKSTPKEIDEPKEELQNVEASNSEAVARRENTVKRCEERLQEVDKAVQSPEFMMKIHRRMTKRRHPQIEMEYEGFHIRGMEIFRKILNSEESKNESITWHTIIMPQMVERICNLMNFLLCNGPMTETEDVMFVECVNVLRSYYEYKSSLISEGDEFHRITTYYPEAMSPVYRFMIEVMEIPKLQDLGHAEIKEYLSGV